MEVEKIDDIQRVI